MDGRHPESALSAAVRRARPLHVAAVIFALYGAWIGAYLAGHDVRDFIRIGETFIAHGRDRSREIRLDRGYRPPANQSSDARGLGYDGQFAYYMALDPEKARYYIDLPSYRYSRVLQPALVRALALGQRDAIPWMFVLVNWLAVGGGTLALAVWLRRRAHSPWWAAIYGLWPGMLVGVQRDLTEPLAYALVAAAILLLDSRRRWGLPAAAVVFALAGLTRSTTLVFPLVFAAWIALRHDDPPVGAATSRAQALRHAALLGAVSVAPFVAYSIFLLAWLGSVGTGGSSAVPFGGVAHPIRLRELFDLGFVVAPMLIAVVAFLPSRKSGRRVGSWLPWVLLLANFLATFVFYGEFYRTTYTTVSRIALGAVVAAVLCLPAIGSLDRRRRIWLAAALVVGMTPLPVVALFGFTNWASVG